MNSEQRKVIEPNIKADVLTNFNFFSNIESGHHV